ncbi:efflux transporter outer membrane subunit [Sphingomonas xinjiangensis]|uniref:NodT family efflux transporter outer membrane factor (OMF) lipoprotein n=1 Tax=Sphingomonas xinjiangensis TaxID=643568 RepID=A0A840YPT4_9SPHN|nr:efflux transporter outer membrane subunit [Sphingomonas xinjiangensis]MBB5710082.1 NodT family efflux transporter outer membrane factor (OMF) lipoprotein [Sphingomonas xinjiangensis]
MKRALVLALLLVSCAGPGPRTAPPAGPQVPQTWREAGTSGGTVQPEWWNAFGDPVLGRLVRQALANNPDIALAASRIQEARAQERLARAVLSPDISAGASAARSRSVGALGTPLEQTQASPALTVAYELDVFGRNRPAREAARLGTIAAQAARDATALTIAATTASNYLALRALDARLQVARDTLAARSEALRVARRRADTGYTSRLELNQAEAEYRATAQVVPQTELAIRRSENALGVLLGIAPTSIPRGRAFADLVLPAVPGGLPSDLLRRRPDIFAAEARIAASDARLESARAQFLPRISLTGSAGVALSSVLADPITLFSLGSSVLAPIFDSGRLRAGVETAASQRDQAAIQYRTSVLTALREVEDGLAAVERQARVEAEVRAQRAALAEALVHASSRYRAGYASYIEQLDAQRGLLSADLTLIQARLDRLTALTDLYRAFGGGWTGVHD